MKISITDHRKIFAIQKEFSELFPYLKPVFFAKASRPDGKPSKKETLHPSKTLGECRTIHNKGTVTITPNMTAEELFQTFRDVYGLSVELYRKLGTEWFEMTPKGEWTLEELNKEGEELAQTISKES